jgi:3-methyladenine DNA glycosylase Tag
VVWRVVQNKWPNFEESFFNFDIEKVLMMPEEMMERKASDPKIIRNFNKVKTIKANAEMIFEQQQQGHSFAEFIAHWPSDDIIGLWAHLKKHGQRLGGNTGPYALRALGKDTFLLSRDVEAYFRAHDIITGGIQTKSSLNAIQASFNSWQQQGDLSLGQLSRLIAYATGDNHIHLEEIADAE